MRVCVVVVPKEGIQKLMALVQAQHKAWKERLVTKAGLQVAGAGKPAPQDQEEEEEGGTGEPGTQHDSLSISTLSTRYVGTLCCHGCLILGDYLYCHFIRHIYTTTLIRIQPQSRFASSVNLANLD